MLTVLNDPAADARTRSGSDRALTASSAQRSTWSTRGFDPHRHDTYGIGEDGFGCRILYIAPELVRGALGGRALPFVADPVQAVESTPGAICTLSPVRNQQDFAHRSVA